MVNINEWYNTSIVEGENGKTYEKYTRTDAKLNKDYASMNSSVDLINAIVDGSRTLDETSETKKARVKSNYEYLEIMVSKTDWDGSSDYTAPDLTNAKKAITDGKTYVGE